MKGRGMEGAAAHDARWTLVTGASSGIGAELARGFAARGRALILVARRRERLEALRDELAGKGARAQVIVADLERPGAGDRLVRTLDERGIVLDTLVNDAGFGLRGGFATMPYEEQMGMVMLNVVAVARLCRLVLPGLIARRRGGILNVASTAAFQPLPHMAVYGATKAFVLSLSEALHEEARPFGVTVTALCPGPTDTEFQTRAAMEKSKMFKHAMSPEAVAEIGIAGYEAGRAIAYAGGLNRLGAAAAQLFPRAWVRRAAARLQG
jgi:short-subunit dehydrogenase